MTTPIIPPKSPDLVAAKGKTPPTANAASTTNGIMRNSSNQLKFAVTGSDVEGPYFLDDAPMRTVLRQGYEFEQLILSGLVYGQSAGGVSRILPGAKVSIWHASPSGIYDFEPSRLLYRGYTLTDNEGAYQFETAIPGAYSEGDLDRPAHIHYKVSADGYEELTTQLYFAGDERLSEDVFVNENNGFERAMPLERIVTGLFRVRFDIHLKPIS